MKGWEGQPKIDAPPRFERNLKPGNVTGHLEEFKNEPTLSA